MLNWHRWYVAQHIYLDLTRYWCWQDEMTYEWSPNFDDRKANFQVVHSLLSTYGPMHQPIFFLRRSMGPFLLGKPHLIAFLCIWGRACHCIYFWWSYYTIDFNTLNILFDVVHTIHHRPILIVWHSTWANVIWHLVLHNKSWRPTKLALHANYNTTLSQVVNAFCSLQF